jgi:Replication protein
MNTLDSSKADAVRSENTPFSGSHLGSMRITQPVNNDAACRALQQKHVDEKTGEIIFFSEKLNGAYEIAHDHPLESRLERWILQSAVKKLLPGKRVAKCCRLRAKTNSTIKVLFNFVNKTAQFGGLQTCGSVWDDPVCAVKISERRRVDEVAPAMQIWESQGGQCLMLTLTHSHHKFNALADLLEGEQKAMSRLTGCKAFRRLCSSIGFKGSIRAWEVTYCDNGFHPHFHLILFVSPELPLDLEVLESAIYELWANACRLAKLPLPDRAYGARLHDGSNAKSYVSKGCWGLDREITKGHLKKSKTGRSPMDLIRSYAFDGDKQAGALFIEYSEAFHGRRQLQWSPGLKSYFGIGEKSDDLIAAEQDDKASVLGEIDWPVWQLVLKSELRGEILELARLGSWDAITRLLDNLKNIEV